MQNNYEKLKDKDFIQWLEKNKIEYKNKDKEYLSALYSEFAIERGL